MIVREVPFLAADGTTYTIRADNKRIIVQLGLLSSYNPILYNVFSDAVAIAPGLQWDLRVTSLWRTKQEDDKLRGSGIHVLWRAIDWATGGVPLATVQNMAILLTQRWMYDPARRDPITGAEAHPLCYTAGHGTGPHFHLQVHPNTVRRA